MSWLSRHAEAVEAAAALVTALVALAALIAVPLQIRANAQLQAEQSARDIYREFVALSVDKPHFANPDYCGLKAEAAKFTAYTYYVEYLLYTSEQVAALTSDWNGVMQSHLQSHLDFMCYDMSIHDNSLAVQSMIVSLTQHYCDEEPTC